MNLFASPTRKALADFAEFIDNAEVDRREFPISLLLGVSFRQAVARNELAKVFNALGFTQKEKFWESTNEAFLNIWERSPQGYFTLSDWDDWRNFLLKNASEKKIYLRLPSGTEFFSILENPDQTTLVKQALNHLCEYTPGLRILFTKYEDAQAQAALFTSLQLLTWPQTWRMLVENMHFNGVLNTQAIESVLASLEEENSTSEILGVIQQLCVRTGKENLANQNDSIGILLGHVKTLLQNFE